METPENEVVNQGGENNPKDESNSVNENANDSGTEANDSNQPESENKSDSTNEKVKELEARLAEINDKYLRLYSEFDNARKRTAKEKLDLIKTAGEDVLKSVLPVIDDFERAIKANASTQDVNTIREGVDLIYNKFRHILQQKGLEAMDSTGKDFDADTMDAITRIPNAEMKGKVVDEVERGYLLNGKVIRFAKVVVGE